MPQMFPMMWKLHLLILILLLMMFLSFNYMNKNYNILNFITPKNKMQSNLIVKW